MILSALYPFLIRPSWKNAYYYVQKTGTDKERIKGRIKGRIEEE